MGCTKKEQKIKSNPSTYLSKNQNSSDTKVRLSQGEIGCSRYCRHRQNVHSSSHGTTHLFILYSEYFFFVIFIISPRVSQTRKSLVPVYLGVVFPHNNRTTGFCKLLVFATGLCLRFYQIDKVTELWAKVWILKAVSFQFICKKHILDFKNKVR